MSITAYTDDVVQLTGDFVTNTQTNDPTPLLKGVFTGLEVDDVLQVYEGSTFLGLATLDTGAGTWTFALPAPAIAQGNDGAHTYHVVIADDAGNQG
ncbi:Ig-like domain-containing protein, partial [Mesorhizobium japonicum]|uniref:Ig-like domain-containing protein n=1 Tax=Mesorhizobium japonicum TaxID=2066070 RepID=UPI003B58BD81